MIYLKLRLQEIRKAKNAFHRDIGFATWLHDVALFSEEFLYIYYKIPNISKHLKGIITHQGHIRQFS